MTLPVSAWVALGSMLGSLTRYCLQLVIGFPEVDQFPWGTLIANTLGSLIIGAVAGLKLPVDHWLAELKRRQFMMTGFCGGFTTLSIFSLQTLHLLESGQATLAAMNVLSTSALMMVAVGLGYAWALTVNNRASGRSQQ